MTPNDIPYGMAYCFATKEQCEKCEKCSHSIAARITTDDLQPVKCIHPLYINKVAAGQPCEYYSEMRMVRVAYGFVHMFDDVPERKAHEARARIQGIYGSRMSYYRSRSGERIIYPEEQERIARIFRQAGIEGTPKFDRYEGITLW